MDVEVGDRLLAAVPSSREAEVRTNFSKRSTTKISLSNSGGRDMSRSCSATGVLRMRVLEEEEELDLAMFFPFQRRGFGGVGRFKACFLSEV
jgi:hypothetical protein